MPEIGSAVGWTCPARAEKMWRFNLRQAQISSHSILTLTTLTARSWRNPLASGSGAKSRFRHFPRHGNPMLVGHIGQCGPGLGSCSCLGEGRLVTALVQVSEPTTREEWLFGCISFRAAVPCFPACNCFVMKSVWPVPWSAVTFRHAWYVPLQSLSLGAL